MNSFFSSQASLKHQLVNFFVVSVALLSVTTSVIIAWQTSQKIRYSTIVNGLQITSNFAEQSLLALLTGSEENGKDAIDNTLGFKSVARVAVFRSDGQLLAASTKQDNNVFVFDSNNIASQVQLLQETEQLWIFSAPVIFTSDEFDAEVMEPDGESRQQELMGYVLVEYDKSELHQIQESIFINNLVISSIVALLLVLLMRWGISRLTQPLSDLSKTMKSTLDSSEYSRAEINGPLEIRRIAEVYNQMMSHLERQSRLLAKHQHMLESEVEIRTQELILARDSALTASRHKSEFLANISHELRTPLQAIIGYTDLVREELEMECMDGLAEDLRKSIRASHNLLRLINNILDLAKIEAGRMDLYLKPVEMEKLISDTVETIQPMAAVNNNQLVVE